MKRIFAFIITTFLVSTALAQTEPVKYKAVVEKFKQYFNNNKPDSLYKMFGAEMKMALTPELTRTTFSGLKAQLGPFVEAKFTNYLSPVASYDANFEKGPLLMYLSVNSDGQIIGLRFAPAQVKAAPIADDPDMKQLPMLLKTITGNISGTYGLPKTISGKIPVVLIIAGSGPTDRDGNSTLGISANSYKMIAAALAKNGIASLRYDKRLIGKSVSSMTEKDIRFEDLSDDAIALIKMLRSDERFSKVIVLGHSEGSLVGMIAANEQPVNGFISVAGAGMSIDKILLEQAKGQSQFIQDGFKRILDTLKKGKTFEKVDPSLYNVFRPSVQPYLISWIAHDPVKDIKKLKIPVLIIQGINDLQVSVNDAEKLKKAKSDAMLLIIPGMNHALKDAPADKESNLATYKDPKLPLNPQLVTGLVDFINKLK